MFALLYYKKLGGAWAKRLGYSCRGGWHNHQVSRGWIAGMVLLCKHTCLVGLTTRFADIQQKFIKSMRQNI